MKDILCLVGHFRVIVMQSAPRFFIKADTEKARETKITPFALKK